jgi:hypothetical protein
MSIKATTFVRRLRGLTMAEKAIAFVLADHEHHKTGRIFPSMSTVAREAGAENRETASRITKRLVEKKVFLPEEQTGKPTVYRVNYALPTCDSPVTGNSVETYDATVTPPVTVPVTFTGPTCDSGDGNRVPGVTLEAGTCDSPVTQRVLREKKERENPREGEKGAAAAAPLVEVLSPVYEEVEEAFVAIGRPPFDSRELQNLWGSFYATRNDDPLSHTMEKFFQEARRRKLNLIPLWFTIKRALENKEVKDAIHPESIQERSLRKSLESLKRVQEEADEYLASTEETTPNHCAEPGCEGYQFHDGKMFACEHRRAAKAVVERLLIDKTHKSIT